MTRKAQNMSSWPLGRKSGRSPALGLHGRDLPGKVKRHLGALCSPSRLCPGLARVLQTARLRTGPVGFSAHTPHTARWVPPESSLGGPEPSQGGRQGPSWCLRPRATGRRSPRGLGTPPSLQGRGEEMPELSVKDELRGRGGGRGPHDGQHMESAGGGRGGSPRRPAAAPPGLGMARCGAAAMALLAGPGGGRPWPAQNQLQVCTVLPSRLLPATAGCQQSPRMQKYFLPCGLSCTVKGRVSCQTRARRQRETHTLVSVPALCLTSLNL